MTDTKKYYVVFDDRCGRAVPDAIARADVEARIKQWNESPKDRFVTDIIGTDMLLLSYRLAISAGLLSIDDVQFYHDEKPIAVNEYGQLIDEATGGWPRGVAHLQTALTLELIRLNCNKQPRSTPNEN